MEFIRMENHEGIVRLTINRPKVLNALDSQVIDGLETAFASLEKDAEAKAVIITGEGEKAFVAGADIKELARLGVASAKEVAARGQSVFRRIEHFPKPVIAAVNGFALGGGCELALACHLRVASSTARLGLPEVKLGLIPGYGGTQRLPRLIGKGAALAMILTGEMVDADTALRIGLVNEVVEPGELLDRCRAIARKIIARGPLAVRAALEAVHHGFDLPQADGERLEASLFGMLAATEDTREGLTAFLEGRAPDFKGA